MKKISVIMGIYNCESTLHDAIESIVNQTYTDWELIMCDDASTDDTYRIAKEYENRYPDKIKVIKNATNLRLAATLNNCLQYATGEYIARMDGDDKSINNRFQKQVDFLNSHPEYDVVGTLMISFDENGDQGIKKREALPKEMPANHVPFAHATIMARKEMYEILNGYRVAKEISRCEDLDMWFRFFEKGLKGYNLQEPLYKVRECASDFERRTLRHAINASIVSYNGYKLLNFPLYKYIYVIKPIVSSLIPSKLMKRYHNLINTR